MNAAIARNPRFNLSAYFSWRKGTSTFIPQAGTRRRRIDLGFQRTVFKQPA